MFVVIEELGSHRFLLWPARQFPVERLGVVQPTHGPQEAKAELHCGLPPTLEAESQEAVQNVAVAGRRKLIQLVHLGHRVWLQLGLLDQCGEELLHLWRRQTADVNIAVTDRVLVPEDPLVGQAPAGRRHAGVQAGLVRGHARAVEPRGPVYRGHGSGVLVSAANRLIGEVVQSRRRPLLGPSPG